MSMLQEFKDFAMKGNVVDLAVGVVIGGAFGKIVSSLVDNVIMPVVGILMKGTDFTKLMLGVGEAQVKYGNFIQAIVDFVIVAAVLFLVVKAINTAKNKVAPKKKVEDVVVESLSKDQELLSEIRDLLKKSK